MPYTEILTFLGTGTMTFLMRFWENRAKEKQENFKMAMGKHEAFDKSADAAAKRVPIDAGKINRRFMVFSLTFAVILAPFLLALMNTPILVEVEVQRREWLFGLVGGGTKTEFVPILGYPILNVVTHLFSVVGGWYFGSKVAK